MTQLPEGVFSVFSAGPRQTALDRLSNDDANPNSVFTRTFAKELTQPGVNLVQVAQRGRKTGAGFGVGRGPRRRPASRVLVDLPGPAGALGVVAPEHLIEDPGGPAAILLQAPGDPLIEAASAGRLTIRQVHHHRQEPADQRPHGGRVIDDKHANPAHRSHRETGMAGRSCGAGQAAAGRPRAGIKGNRNQQSGSGDVAGLWLIIGDRGKPIG